MRRLIDPGCIVRRSLALSLALFMSIGCESDKSFENKLFDYQEVLLRDPTSCFHAKQIAYIYQYKREYSNAIEYFDRAIENCPNDPMAKFQMGVTYQLLNEYENADIRMKEALQQAKAQQDEELFRLLSVEMEQWRNYRE